jgi:putative nucleotidyltransferase with HDIG domain
MNVLLAKTVSKLSRSLDPAVADALTDLKSLGEAIGSMQEGISGYLKAGKHQFMAMAEIEHMMSSSQGLDRVLEGVMDTVISLMHAERGFLMLQDQGELTIHVARGLDHADLNKESFALSKTIVQKVASTGEPVLSINAQEDPRFGNEMSVIALNLRSILSVPLRLKDTIIGVIFLDNRIQTGLFNQNDLELLSAFADQAAVAIDNARLFDGLQKANKELESANEELQIAYDATLKGWVRALDMRDKETKGHTQRVTGLARILAREVGVKEADLVHITRGALLHDIGKIGVPDSILLKPSTLTPEEWDRMKRHTILAFEMLNPIEFLRPAIDVPYCHHEKWDGGGYPRGLKGEDIPLTARIFSIVDVWDALTSDRPYHRAITKEETQLYIRKQAGSQFDPRLVEAFLNLKDLSAAIENEQLLFRI